MAWVSRSSLRDNRTTAFRNETSLAAMERFSMQKMKFGRDKQKLTGWNISTSGVISFYFVVYHRKAFLVHGNLYSISFRFLGPVLRNIPLSAAE
jgi:hypothetical protein